MKNRYESIERSCLDMGRTRIEEAPVLKSWGDVNADLREIAEEELTLLDIDGDMNKQIIGIKKTAEQDAKPHVDRIAKLEKDLKEFTDTHREELGKRKTMALNFGSVGFQLSTAITVPTAKEKLDEIIKKLRARKMGDCIVTKETVNKDALLGYGEDRVTAVGAGWKQKDVFWYEAARDKLEKIPAGQD